MPRVCNLTRPIAAITLLLVAPAAAGEESGEAVQECTAPVSVSEADLAAAQASRAVRLDTIRAYLAARRAAAQGRREEALDGLRTLDKIGAPVLPGPQEPFARWQDDEDVGAVLASMRTRLALTENGRVALEVAGTPLTAEGIAYDPEGDRLFLTNWFDDAIYTLTRDGTLEQFLALPDLTPNGIAVDPREGTLWFVATNAFRDGATEPRSELWRIDLATGEEARFTAAGAKGFNDLAISAFGHVYVSDTPGGEVYVLEAGADRLRRLLPEKHAFQRPNGVAVDESGRHLFVAQGLDLLRIDLYTNEATEIALPAAVETLGTDGLYFREGKLYAIQNLLTPGTLVEIALDETKTRAISYRVLERGNSRFDLPTTGAFVGDEFWMMASTQLYLYGEDRRPQASDVKPLTLLAYRLCE